MSAYIFGEDKPSRKIYITDDRNTMTIRNKEICKLLCQTCSRRAYSCQQCSYQQRELQQELINRFAEILDQIYNVGIIDNISNTINNIDDDISITDKIVSNNDNYINADAISDKIRKNKVYTLSYSSDKFIPSIGYPRDGFVITSHLNIKGNYSSERRHIINMYSVTNFERHNMFCIADNRLYIDWNKPLNNESIKQTLIHLLNNLDFGVTEIVEHLVDMYCEVMYLIEKLNSIPVMCKSARN